MNNLNVYLKRIFFIIIFIIIYNLIIFNIFSPIYFSNNIIINFALHPFNICETNLDLWIILKYLFIFSNIFNSLLLSYLISIKLFSKNKKNHKSTVLNINKSELNIKIGYDENNTNLYLSEKSLYQNILITGSIGSGKTSSAMYPITKQLIKYKSNNTNEKLGMLILDVKGNYYSKVKDYLNNYNREKDLIVIDLSRKY